MDLYIIRHAWAGHFGDPAWPNDAERPLSEEGRARFAQMVECLVDRGFAPEIIATSPMVRCRQTAQVIAEALPDNRPVEDRDELLPGSALGLLLRWTEKMAAEHDQIAWVGHAPDVSRLTAGLIGDGNNWIRFGKGTVAAIRFDDRPALGQGELRWLVTAKVLGC